MKIEMSYSYDRWDSPGLKRKKPHTKLNTKVL